MVRHRFVTSCLALLALVAFSGVSLAQGRNFNVEKKITIEPGWQVMVRLEFTKDGKVIDRADWKFQNDTELRAEAPIQRNAPRGTNDRHYGAFYSKLGNGLPIVSYTELPTGLVEDFAVWLFESGYIFGVWAFQTPLAIADLNADGMMDEKDASLFARIDDPYALAPFANEAYFPLGSVLLTDKNGQLPEIPGLTFYMDPDFTIPYAEAPILVTGIASEWVFGGK